MKDFTSRSESLLGFAVLGCLTAGLCGLLAALVAILGGEWVGAGLFLGSAALAFGLMSNALIRE